MSDNQSLIPFNLIPPNPIKGTWKHRVFFMGGNAEFANELSGAEIRLAKEQARLLTITMPTGLQAIVDLGAAYFILSEPL